MHIDEARCEQFGLDARKVMAVARRLSNAAREAQKMGLKVFGGAGSGSLRVSGGGSQNDVARLDGNFDGGDGGDEY